MLRPVSYLLGGSKQLNSVLEVEIDAELFKILLAGGELVILTK